MKLPSYLIGMVLFITLFVIVCANSYHKKIQNKEKYSDLSSFSRRLLTIHDGSIEEIRKLHVEIKEFEKALEPIECDTSETTCPSNCDIYSYFTYGNTNYDNEDDLKRTNSNAHCTNNPCDTFEYTYHVGLSNCPDQTDNESRQFTITDNTLCGELCDDPDDGPGGDPDDGPGGDPDDGPGGDPGGPGGDPGGGPGGVDPDDNCTVSTYFEYNGNQYSNQDQWDSQLSTICSSNLCSNISYSINTDYTNCPDNLSNRSTQLTHKCDDPSCSLYCEEATKYATITGDQYDSLEDLKNNVCTYRNLYYDGNYFNDLNYQRLDGSNCDGQFSQLNSNSYNVALSNLCDNHVYNMYKTCETDSYSNSWNKTIEYRFNGSNYADSNALITAACKRENSSNCGINVDTTSTLRLSNCENPNDDGEYINSNQQTLMYYCPSICRQPRSSNCLTNDFDIYFDINANIDDGDGGLSFYDTSSNFEYDSANYIDFLPSYRDYICPIANASNDLCQSNIYMSLFNYINDSCISPNYYSGFIKTDDNEDLRIEQLCPEDCSSSINYLPLNS